MKISKKIVLIVLFVLMINIASSLIFQVFAADLPQNIIQEPVQANTIVSMSSKTVNTKTEFYLILNLSNISYTKFRVDITNSNSLIVEELTENVSSLSTNNVATSFVVDKNQINLEKLGVVYTSPEKEGTIKFSVKITNLDDTKENLSNKLSSIELTVTELKDTLKSLKDILAEIEDKESELYLNTEKSIKEANAEIAKKEQEKAELQTKIDNFSEGTDEEASINVTNKETSSESPWGDKDSMFMDKDKEKEMNASMKEMMQKMNNMEFDLKSANDRISSLTQGETYKGSANNYLKSLSITDVKFKNEFKKTNTNYFARLDDDDKTSVTVNVVAEDSTAIITIYGNTELTDGKNKIIINVTADNGDVRTYKIYLTK